MVEPPAGPAFNDLKPGSPGEEMSHEAHLRKTGGRQSRRNEAHSNPVQLMPPRFEHEHEHEHEDEHEDDLVAAPLLCASVVNPLPPSAMFRDRL